MGNEQEIRMYEEDINDLQEVIWNSKQEIKELKQALEKLRKNKDG